jgi:hypothetical protein
MLLYSAASALRSQITRFPPAGHEVTSQVVWLTSTLKATGFSCHVLEAEPLRRPSHLVDRLCLGSDLLLQCMPSHHILQHFVPQGLFARFYVMQDSIE